MATGTERSVPQSSNRATAGRSSAGEGSRSESPPSRWRTVKVWLPPPKQAKKGLQQSPKPTAPVGEAEPYALGGDNHGAVNLPHAGVSSRRQSATTTRQLSGGDDQRAVIIPGTNAQMQSISTSWQPGTPRTQLLLPESQEATMSGGHGPTQGIQGAVDQRTRGQREVGVQTSEDVDGDPA